MVAMFCFAGNKADTHSHQLRRGVIFESDVGCLSGHQERGGGDEIIIVFPSAQLACRAQFIEEKFMSLLGMVVANKGLQLLYQAGSSYLQSENDAKVVVEQVVPVVSKALEAKTADKKGLGDMLKYLEGAGLQRFVENPDLIKTEEAKNAGLGVLSNLLGLSPTSGKMVGVLASRTGLSSSAVQSLLPLAASIVMGSLSKNVLQPEVKSKILAAVNRRPRFGFLSALGGMFGGGSSGHIGKSVLGTMIVSGVDHDEKWVQDAFSND